MDMIQDKRQCKRRRTKYASISLRSLDPQAWFKFWGGAECFLRDLSLLGVGVYSQEKLPIGTRLSIDLRLGKQASSIRVFGRITWTEKEDDQYRSGVSFSWWRDDQDKKIVSSFVERLGLVN
ncbi:MAG: PilZ domain-containing protein [Candidatus Omnitrophota bacterium]